MTMPRLRSPIVLVHGLLGFDTFRFGRSTVNYFPGIADTLEEAGNRVFTARLSPTDGVARRARELRDFVERVSPHEPVHLIAHSLGGLDSRYMISRLGMASRVLTLTTIGTPHRGTTFADWGVARFAKVAEPLFRWLRQPCQAFHDLTTTRCRSFNAATPDAPGVRYFSVAGRCEGFWLGLEWLLPHRIVLRAEGPNDGVVSVASARYGEVTDIWDGDHMNLVNWPNFKAVCRGVWSCRSREYGQLLGRLRDLGY